MKVMGHSVLGERSTANGEGAIGQSLHNRHGRGGGVDKHVCADAGVSSSKTWARGQMFGLRKTLCHNYFLS